MLSLCFLRGQRYEQRECDAEINWLKEYTRIWGIVRAVKECLPIPQEPGVKREWLRE